MEFLDYETLRLIWWLLIGVLLIGFAIMDGFDLGVAALLPFAARTDDERRVVLNSIGPTWDGNQVWFILGGGAVFAAFPLLYAAAFSGFYLAMFLLLLTFIVRPVGFEFRSKIADPRWRSTWDWLLCGAGTIAALVFGVAIGNLFLGVPFHFDQDLRFFYTGSFFGLFTPFALLCGVTSVTMLLMHGATFLRLKTDGAIATRAGRVQQIAAVLTLLLFTACALWAGYGLDGYTITAGGDPSAPSNPLTKTVVTGAGAWHSNWAAFPLAWLVTAVVWLGALATAALATRAARGTAFVTSALTVAGIIVSVGITLFPFFMPSSSAPSMSLTLWDASSSRTTLLIMLVATVIFMPLILAYTSWVYRVMRGTVSSTDIARKPKSFY